MSEKYVKGLVSVIMPAYNAEKYIMQAIDSVLSQTYKSIEIIVIDDCSTDRTKEKVLKYSNVPNVFYCKAEVNNGVAAARNLGISKAKGQYIAFLDSDDVWVPTKIERQIQIMSETKTPLAFTAIEYINSESERIKGKRAIKERVTYKLLQKNTMIATSSVVVDRNIVGDFVFPNRKTCEDYSLWLQILKEYGDAIGIDEALVQYRILATSLSSNKAKEIKHFYLVQTQDLHINKIKALFNMICYILNAIKKHYFQ